MTIVDDLIYLKIKIDKGYLKNFGVNFKNIMVKIVLYILEEGRIFTKKVINHKIEDQILKEGNFLINVKILKDIY